jgi:hypothetical protein
MNGIRTTTLVVIGTDCIGSCKSNYYTITITTVPLFQWQSNVVTQVVPSRPHFFVVLDSCELGLVLNMHVVFVAGH